MGSGRSPRRAAATEPVIRVVLADDDVVLTESFATVLRATPGFEVAGTARNGEEAVRVVLDTRPDVLVLDYSMPVKDGPVVAAELHEQAPAVRILVLSRHDAVYYPANILQVAHGYLVKSCGTEEVIRGIRAVHAGEVYVSGAIAGQLAAYRARTPSDPLDRLSPREFQYVRCVVLGRERQQAAEFLGISPNAISVYRDRVLKKLGLRNNLEIVHYAMERGIVE